MPDAAVIDAIGHYIPAGRETNDELARVIDTSDEWIRTRTGIAARSRAAADEPTSALAATAGRAALARSMLARVDSVVVATTTPDMKCPATAPVVADALGLGEAGTFDVNSACTGFLAGLAAASGLIAAGHSASVLLIGAEKYSSIVDRHDRATAPIFADGAGAVVLRAGRPDEPGAIGQVVLGSDGALWKLTHVKSGGSKHPWQDGSDEHDPYIRMEGRATYRQATTRMVESCQLALKARSMSVEDVDFLVAHQANVRILKEVARELGIPEERAVVDLADIGNTAAASIPIALSRAWCNGTLRGGETLLLTAFGAGTSWGATVLRWPRLRMEGED
ncbi:MAG TPA: beta-ketoacyl-ACP synthase III [Micromonosporaceae bacterium]